jgi:DNA-binding transcriptional LysR family regulator
MKYNLAAIRTFLEVADAGGFRRAAERLGLAVATVSQHVATLESELGVKLFDRTTRRVVLTRTGRTYFEQCRRLFAQIEEVSDGTRAASQEPLGLLRVSASSTFGREMLLPLILDFMKINPSAQVDIHLTGRYVDLDEENIDLAIRTGKLRSADAMAYRELPSIPLLLCAAPSYLASHGEPAKPQELENHRCIVQTHRPQDHAWRLVHRSGTEHLIRAGGPLTVNDTAALTKAALEGFGIISTADYLVHEHLASGRLVRVLPGYRPRASQLLAAYRPDDRSALKVRSCLDYLAGELAVRLRAETP